MEKRKPSTQSTAYTGRFGDESASGRSHAPARPRPVQPTDGSHRPSGFGTAGRPVRPKPAPEPEKPRREAPKAPEKKKPDYSEAENTPRRKPSIWKVVLCVFAFILVALFALVMAIGYEPHAYHQMPVIERESIGSFTPEETPMPGMEAP